MNRLPTRILLKQSILFNALSHKYQHFSTCSQLLMKHIDQSKHIYNKNLQATLQFKLADIGEGIAEVNIKEWYVKVGDSVKQFDRICEVQSDKATVTITSRYDGVIAKVYYNTDEVALVGKPLVDIETSDNAQTTTVPETIHVEDSVEKSTPEKSNQEFKINKVLATPSVRKLAIDNKVNLADVQGSGKDGRILKDDIIRYLKETGKPRQDDAFTASSEAQPIAVSSPPPPPPSSASKGPVAPIKPFKMTKLTADKKEAIKGMKKVMVKTMTQANAIPHFTYGDEYDMSALIRIRSNLKQVSKERGINVSYLPFIIKACSVALHSFPVLNATVDEKCDNITYKKAHNIGVAMDTNDGLIVPNIKNVEDKTVFDIANELNRLQILGAANKLAPSDLLAVLSPYPTLDRWHVHETSDLTPEVAIGAFGKIQKVPKFDENNQVIASSVMQVSWAGDHRVIDGATMARFSNLVKEYLENPSRLLLDLK